MGGGRRVTARGSWELGEVVNLVPGYSGSGKTTLASSALSCSGVECLP